MITPCIHFQGNCDEAIVFYQHALGAQVKGINYAKDAPAGSGMDVLPPNFVMHSDIDICGTLFSLTDGAEKPITGESFSFLISYDTAEKVKVAYQKLLEGGKIVEDLAPVFWSELYAYVIDRFGVNWQVMVKSQ